MINNRIPRKKKKLIPEGLYCYTPINFDHKTGIFHIKPCHYYEYVKDIEGKCRLLNCEVVYHCKECNTKTNAKENEKL